MKRLASFLISSATALAAVSSVHDASACGGCFHPKAEVGSSVITDHRMVFKISKEETILWDQVRYSGDPEEFAWVLPVRAGAKIELSRDAWIAALDATTTTTVSGPERFCGNGGGGGGGGSGCGGSSDALFLSGGGSSSGSAPADGGFSGSGSVSVVSQSVIGPYQAVTLRSANGEGISEWLLENDFAIPDEVRPTVDAYTTEGFDFIALRLRPGQGVRAMRPVRVVTQGADVTLPLRMVAAGVGAKVGLTLWVISEGRYRVQNFPNAVVDTTKLKWDGVASRSNLSTLQSDIFVSNEGRTWLTEVSAPLSQTRFEQGFLDSLSLAQAYKLECTTQVSRRVPCNENELPPPDGRPVDPPDDAGTNDAGTNDASTPPDAGTSSPPSSCFKTVNGCDGYDDDVVAFRNLHENDVWVTRLRADLPVGALSTDMRLEAGEQTTVTRRLHTEEFTDPKFDPCAGRGNNATSDDSNAGCACHTTTLRDTTHTWLLIGLTAFVASRVARRRRR